ncbi:MAG: hypothetical protein NC421_07225 [Lachnospiraceae bacterium]|nr:hypothetical protein [Lachnospiraceae bacterium]
MRKAFYLTLLAALAIVMPQQSMAQVPSFPGAEGYGRLTTGGRGGEVYHVTTLDDTDAPGSFRYACNQKGTRTIVFDVSGTIFLKSALQLRNGNVTIAGQTAPGDGICIADYPFTINSSNVIIRFMRFRVGNRQVANHEGDGLGAMDQANIIIDHCSVSWSIDECLSVYGSKDITVQWCISSQSLRNAGHAKGSHGYGGNWGGSGASYHHNLIAHHTSRTPRLGPRPGTQTDERMDMRNNVIYNHGSLGCYGGEGMNVNIVNNYYKVGPQKNNNPQRIAGIGIRTTEYTKHDTPTPNQWDVMWHKWGTFYVDGNVNPDYQAVTKDNWTYGIYNQIDNSKCDGTFNEDVKRDMRLDTPIEYHYTTTHTAEKAYEKVLDYVGASLHRDALDEIIVNDVRNRKGTFGDNGIIDNQDQVKYADGSTGWPALQQTAAEVDTDGDGMPDKWETDNGLDPNDKTDGAKIGADGYTNLEVYMNSLVAEIMERGNAEGKLLSGNLESSDPAVELPKYEAPEVVDYQLNSATYKQSPSKTVWEFEHGFSITNTRDKGYSTGSQNRIKYSSGVQYTVNIPAGMSVTGMDVEGYNNYTTADAYFSEINGVDGSAYIFPSTKDAVSHSIDFASPVSSSVTFTPAGNQIVLAISLHVANGSSGIENIVVSGDNNGDNRIFNLMGVEVSEPLAPGIYIRNGKKFMVK